MGCLHEPEGSQECDLHKKVLAHMMARWKSQPLEAWRKRLHELHQDFVFGRLVLKEGPGVGDAGRAFQRAKDWVASNAWSEQDGVDAQKKMLQRYMEDQI